MIDPLLTPLVVLKWVVFWDEGKMQKMEKGERRVIREKNEKESHPSILKMKTSQRSKIGFPRWETCDTFPLYQTEHKGEGERIQQKQLL